MTLDERLEALTHTVELLALGHSNIEARQAAAEERQTAAEERHAREMAEIRQVLRRAIRLAVQEARNERRKRRELDERMDDNITKLAAAQVVTEETLRAFIQSMTRGGNGHQ